MSIKFINSYLGSDSASDIEVKEVNNIQSADRGTLPFFTAIMSLMLAPTFIITGSLAIVIIVLVLSVFYFIHTLFTNKYCDRDFYITNIMLKDNILYLKKDAGYKGSWGSMKPYIRSYDVEKLSILNLNTRNLSSNERIRKLPLLYQNYSVEMCLEVKTLDDYEKFYVYFKPSEDSYKKISQIIKLLESIPCFKQQFNYFSS